MNIRDLTPQLAAVGIALLVGMVMLFAVGANPMIGYWYLFDGAFGGTREISLTLIKSAPLVLTGLSVAVAFRAGMFNIGGNGQLIMGLLMSGVVALSLGGLPQMIHLPLVIIAGTLAGAAWGALAGWLKAVRGAHEVITTIMLNYIAIKIVSYLVSDKGPLVTSAEGLSGQSDAYPYSAGFPWLWDAGGVKVHLGVILAALAATAIWYLLARMTLGYEIRAVGLNPDAARYGGINVERTLIMAMAIAGALAGIAGVSIGVGDAPFSIESSEVSGLQAGFTGIAVALLGRNTVPGVVAAAILFGALDVGGTAMQFQATTIGLPSGAASDLIAIVQGLIIFFVGMDAIWGILAEKRRQRAAAATHTAVGAAA